MDLRTTIDPQTRTLVYQWSYRLLRNHHDALDATQEVLLRAMTRAAGGVENASAWLRRVTVNYCLDMLRRRRPGFEAGAEQVDDRPAANPAMARELHEAVVAGLARLSDHQRAVLVAKVYDRQTFAEIAASMGISTSSAKTHYLRALHLMRGILQGFAED